jgi:hypothetical protein
MSEQDELGLAEQHVIEARQIVARQKQRILQLDSVGADIFGARQTLIIFEDSLRIFEGHRDYLKKQREHRPSWWLKSCQNLANRPGGPYREGSAQWRENT